MRRLLVAATLAAMGLTLAVPLASAHLDGKQHILDWGKSPAPTTASDGGQVWANDEVVGARATFLDGVKSWDVVIRPPGGGAPSTCHEDLAQAQNGKYPTDVYISCPWDTTRATEQTLAGATLGNDAGNSTFSRTWQSRDLGPAPNGKYTIEVSATSAGQSYTCGALGLGTCSVEKPEDIGRHYLYQPETNPPRLREVFVVNDVAAPGGVNSSFDQAANRISVAWAPNPEPDVSYIVQEKVGDGKWSSGVGVPGTRYERTLDTPGRYQYRVAAVRPAPTRDKGDATKRSDYIAASAVDVANITPPSTAGAAPNGADGAGGGGDQGVSIPTDTTSPTPVTAGGKASPGKTNARPGGSAVRPAGSSSRPTGSTAHQAGEEEGEGPDTGFSPELPYNLNQGDDMEEGDDGLADEGDTETLAGGVIPKPRDTRQLMIFTAGAIMLFVIAMQITFMLRRSRPVATPLSPIGAETYHDDFDDWLGF
jgi:hypothetical protein